MPRWEGLVLRHVTLLWRSSQLRSRVINIFRGAGNVSIRTRERGLSGARVGGGNSLVPHGARTFSCCSVCGGRGAEDSFPLPSATQKDLTCAPALLVSCRVERELKACEETRRRRAGQSAAGGRSLLPSRASSPGIPAAELSASCAARDSCHCLSHRRRGFMSN